MVVCLGLESCCVGSGGEGGVSFFPVLPPWSSMSYSLTGLSLASVGLEIRRGNRRGIRERRGQGLQRCFVTGVDTIRPQCPSGRAKSHHRSCFLSDAFMVTQRHPLCSLWLWPLDENEAYFFLWVSYLEPLPAILAGSPPWGNPRWPQANPSSPLPSLIWPYLVPEMPFSTQRPTFHGSATSYQCSPLFP